MYYLYLNLNLYLNLPIELISSVRLLQTHNKSNHILHYHIHMLVRVFYIQVYKYNIILLPLSKSIL